MTNHQTLERKWFFAQYDILQKRIYLLGVAVAVKWMGIICVLLVFCFCFGLGFGHEVIQFIFGVLRR